MNGCFHWAEMTDGNSETLSFVLLKVATRLVITMYMPPGTVLQGRPGNYDSPNSAAGAFSVLVSTNLVNWNYLGPATPRYGFTDTNAPAAPKRFYRLIWP